MTTSLPIALAAFVLLIAAVGWNALSPSRLRTALVLAVSIGWLLVNKPIEGPVLLTFSKQRGLTASDLLPLLTVGLSVGLVITAEVRRRRSVPPRQHGHIDLGRRVPPATQQYEDNPKRTQGSASWRRQRQ